VKEMTPSEREELSSSVSDIIMQFLGVRFSATVFTKDDIRRSLPGPIFDETEIAISSAISALERVGFIQYDDSNECYIPDVLGSEDVIAFAYGDRRKVSYTLTVSADGSVDLEKN
jgi:hypothetical protein